ncbi:hypothetical protein Syun_023948 [Stephania yunnanensis]|uniref:Protein kinase domain-containing protein n=1 Tax=Stephania yunnanensis TaxID=152371 RepID=A0AAP0I2L4_9MAGN
MGKLLNIQLSQLPIYIESTWLVSGKLSSYGYEAPEFEKGSYTFKSDIYSFGVVLLELLTGRNHTTVFYFQNFLLCPISSSLLSSLASIDWKSFGLNVKSSAIDEDGDAVLEWENLPPLSSSGKSNTSIGSKVEFGVQISKVSKIRWLS